MQYDIKARRVVRYYVDGKGYASLLHLCRTLAKRELQDLVFGKDWEKLTEAIRAVHSRLHEEAEQHKHAPDPVEVYISELEREATVDLYRDYFSTGPRSQCSACGHVGNDFSDRCWYCHKTQWIATRAQEIAAEFRKNQSQ